MKIEKFQGDYAGYLSDESRKAGTAQAIAFPKTERDVIAVLKQCSKENMPITAQGFRTGIGGGCVPEGGCILNFENMNKIIELNSPWKEGLEEPIVCEPKMLREASIACEPGITLLEMGRYIAEQTGGLFFFPPDPTEQTATVGGAVSCNASGAKSFGYGSVRDYVLGLHIVLYDGTLLRIKRGEFFANGREFSLPIKDKQGNLVKTISGKLPTYEMPKTKNAAGYYAKDHMDLIDLFIGAQGTLGVITQIELKLLKTPGITWGMVCFFEEEGQAVSFSKTLRGITVSAEFFDQGSLAMVPHIEKKYKSAVFVEYEEETEEGILANTRKLGELLALHGGNVNHTWIASNHRDFREFKELRHSIPEHVNLKIDEMRKINPAITKLGSDMATKPEDLEDMIKIYQKDLKEAGLEYVIFGHIGDNHLHVNIISHNEQQYEEGRRIFESWARIVSQKGGSVSAEHGIGKLKREYLIMMYGDAHVEEMRQLKKSFDPSGLLCVGNIFTMG